MSTTVAPTAAASVPAAAPQCPMHAGRAAAATASGTVQPDDLLMLPLHQRVVVQHADNEDGVRELRLFYGDKEISFDEPELFTFGQTLAQQSQFEAAQALQWGEPGDWPRVQGLLQALVEAGVLRQADEAEVDERIRGEAGARPSPLKPALTDRPRSWHECPGLMEELTGRPLDIGWLELVVPIFRVAHMALDAEGRQVGESNAFPAVLRLDVPTRWRTCIYAGSRFQDDKPMNVSALKAMRAHWGPMMALLLQVRAAYLARCPEARPENGGWTVGHLERMSTAVLALPALQLMRKARRVANGDLHPVLSSMFRVTDGLRMTMHHMLFIPFGEPTRKPDTPMTSAEVHAYAERAFSLHSEHGVCAGPKAMIDEFLSVLVDGQLPRDGLPAMLDDALLEAITDIQSAIDYALLGLKAYAAVFSLWPITMRCYEQLHTLAEAWALDEPTPPVLALQQWLQPVIERLRTSTHLATEAWRADREFVYNDMYAQSERALNGALPAPTLAQRLAPRPADADAAWVQALMDATLRHFGTGTSTGTSTAASTTLSAHRLKWLNALAQYVQQAQAVVRTACAVQAHTNRLLGRDEPRTPFHAADIDSYVQLVGMTEERVPFLLTELERVFGLHIDITAEAVTLSFDTVSTTTACIPHAPLTRRSS